MEIVDMTGIDHPEHYQGAFECIDEMVAPMVAPGAPIDSFCLN